MAKWDNGSNFIRELKCQMKIKQKKTLLQPIFTFHMFFCWRCVLWISSKRIICPFDRLKLSGTKKRASIRKMASTDEERWWIILFLRADFECEPLCILNNNNIFRIIYYSVMILIISTHCANDERQISRTSIHAQRFVIIIINSISRLIKAPLWFDLRHAHLATIKNVFYVFIMIGSSSSSPIAHIQSGQTS